MKRDHDPGPLPMHRTCCKHCDQVFTAVAAPVIGETPNQKYQVWLQGLFQHIVQKHPEVAQEMLHGQGLFGTMLCLDQYVTDDDGLAGQRNSCRAWVHHRTTRVKVSDETIDQKVSLLALEPDKQSAVVSLLKEMRDVFEERGVLEGHPQNGQPRVILPS